MPYDSKQVSSSRGSQLVPLKTEIGNLFSYLQNENQQFQIPTFQIFWEYLSFTLKDLE